MNANELKTLAERNRLLNNVLKGVFSSNTLPRTVTSYPSAYICNTEPSHLPGAHWIVFWIHSPKYADFYDSLGKPPQHYDQSFQSFLERNCEVCVYNNVRLQSKDSNTCGYHVLFYLWMKCYNHSLLHMIYVLLSSSDPDVYVSDFIKRYF